jgi:hypothetical protein
MGEPVTAAREADRLADHVADDLMTLDPRGPEKHWVEKQ